MLQTEFVPNLEEIATRLTADIPAGPEDLIPGLLPRQGQLVIAGETNVGKSLTALEIVSCLTTGEPLWGELEPTRQLKKILYVLGEHYVEVIQRLHRVTKLPMTDQVFILGPEALGYDKWLVTSGRPNIPGIDKFKRWADGVDMIVFDPFSSFVCGTDVENDNVAMRLALDSMSLIAQTAGASCLVLAHQGKPMRDQYGGEHHRKAYAIRGASAIEDAATNIFYLAKDDGTSRAAAKDGLVLTMKCRKYKGIAPAEYKLLRNPQTLTHTLISDKPYAESLKIDTNVKIARLQASNDKLDFRTAIRLVGAMEGVSEETIKRRIGLKQAENE